MLNNAQSDKHFVVMDLYSLDWIKIELTFTDILLCDIEFIQ